MKYISTHDKDAVQEVLQLALDEKPYECSAALREKIMRYKYVYDQVKAYRTARDIEGHAIRRTICHDLAKTFAISISQAYVDWEMASTYLQLEDPLPTKMVSLKIAINQFDEQIEEARAAGDFRAVAQIGRNKIQAISLLPSEKTVDWTTIAFPKVVAVFDPRLFKSKESMSFEQMTAWIERIQEKEKKASDMMGYLAEDVAFKDVDDEN